MMPEERGEERLEQRCSDYANCSGNLLIALMCSRKFPNAFRIIIHLVSPQHRNTRQGLSRRFIASEFHGNIHTPSRFDKYQASRELSSTPFGQLPFVTGVSSSTREGLRAREPHPEIVHVALKCTAPSQPSRLASGTARIRCPTIDHCRRLSFIFPLPPPLLRMHASFAHRSSSGRELQNCGTK